MPKKRELHVGVSACFFHADPNRPIFKGKTLLYIEQSMSDWLQNAGITPFLIPTSGKTISPQLMASKLDGLVLQGGSDVSPQSYGESPLQPQWSGDFVRDQYEIKLVKAFYSQNKPILGICRGLQLINVAFGGTLYQDLDSQKPSKIKHRNWDIYDQNFHEIKFTQNSFFSDLFKNQLKSRRPLYTNSVHHQGIKDLAKHFTVEAMSSDGCIEAIKHKTKTIHAVQWHPEFQDSKRLDLVSSKVLISDFAKSLK
jgi:putative glutamine amidotransferase